MSGDKKKDDLRVIDDLEPAEKITRLGDPAGETPPPRKRANLRRSHEKQALIQDLKESKSPSPVTEDLEEGLTATTPSAPPVRIPPAVFVIAALAFLTLFGLGIFLTAGSRNQQTSENIRATIRQNIKEAAEEKESARAMVQQLLECVENYTSAKTIEEKLAFARQPGRVAPLMKDYYAKRSLEVLTGARLLNQRALPIESRSFVVLTVGFDDDSRRIFLAEVANDLSVRIDWESDVCYQPVEISEYIAQRPTELVLLRVLARPDNFYVYEFSDSGQYQCLQLNFRDSDEVLYGYAQVGTPVSEKIKHHFELSRRMGKSAWEPLLLKVRFLEDGRSERGVLIEEFLAPRWANIDEFRDEN